LFTVATPILNPRFQLVNMSSDANKRTHSIATMGADGIGPEVVNAGVQYIPDGGLEKLKKHDAILFGAVGAPGTLRGTELRILMCWIY
jgi:isocitrate/isopropylmalate dehydrogenase